VIGRNLDQGDPHAVRALDPRFDQSTRLGSSYREYIDPVDLFTFQFIGNQIASDVAKVQGSVYTVEPSFGLYPTTGTNPEYA
jgi:hypothetical protein